MGRHLKPQAGHTLVSESAHSSPSEGLQVTDRQTQQTLQPTQRLLLWLLRPAGPSRTEQLLLWSRRVTGWPTPLTSRHCSRDTAPHQGGTSPLPPEGAASPPAPTRPPSPLKFWSQQSKHSGLPDPRAGCPRRHLEARACTASLPTGSRLESTPARASERLCPPQCRPQASSRERGTDVPQLAQQFSSLRLPGPPTGTKAQSPHRDPALGHSDFSKHEGNS